MDDAEKLAKSSLDEAAIGAIHDAAPAVLPASDHEITVSYYPSKWHVLRLIRRFARRQRAGISCLTRISSLTCFLLFSDLLNS